MNEKSAKRSAGVAASNSMIVSLAAWCRQHAVAAILILIGLGSIAFGLRLLQRARDPRTYLLTDQSQAKWIRPFNAFNLGTHEFVRPMEAMFRRKFDLAKPVENARLQIQAFRRCAVWIDQNPYQSQPLLLTPSDYNTWKKEYEIRLPGRLEAGSHQLLVQVNNQAAHNALLLSSTDLGIFSDGQWEATELSSDWIPVALCSDPSTTVTAQVEAAGYSGVPEAFRQLATWITALFVFFTVTAFFADRRTDSEFALRLRAGQWRWLLLTAWIGFALNNLWKVAPEIGFDVNDHIDYVKYLLANHRIPLAVDGWQMFQSPLVYLISAPFYALFSSLADPTVCLKLMRIFSLVCGVAQVELCYRVSRIVYPEKNDLQIVATTVGSLIPMSLYMSSVFGNEPLAGALTSVLVLLCTWMLSTSPSEQTSRIAVLIGVFWGLAMLTKVTPLLLGPVIILAVMVHRLIMHPGSDRVFTTLRTIFLACFVTCGWYYGRNWIVLGTPFVGGWDPSRGIPWWQDPSYRTWSQVTSFGKCLQQPIYSGVVSFWDAIYSTMWSDGFLSGTIMQADRLPWNVSWMQVGAWLSLLPAACILLGLCRIGLFKSAATKACLLFAAASIGIYLAAVFDLYLQIPIFSAAKSSYMLGLLPCFGILAASGASAVLNFRWLRPIFFGWLGCWSVASYAAYFCIR